jgi:hypothetical protein
LALIDTPVVSNLCARTVGERNEHFHRRFPEVRCGIKENRGKDMPRHGYEMKGLAKHFKEANSAGRKRMCARGDFYGRDSLLRPSQAHPQSLLNWFRWYISIYLRDYDLLAARQKALSACREKWQEESDVFSVRRRLFSME